MNYERWNNRPLVIQVVKKVRLVENEVILFRILFEYRNVEMGYSTVSIFGRAVIEIVIWIDERVVIILVKRNVGFRRFCFYYDECGRS